MQGLLLRPVNFLWYTKPMRYIVERIVGTLTYQVVDTKSDSPVPVLIAGHVLATVFDTREEAQKIAANCNRVVAVMYDEGKS